MVSLYFRHIQRAKICPQHAGLIPYSLSSYDSPPLVNDLHTGVTFALHRREEQVRGFNNRYIRLFLLKLGFSWANVGVASHFLRFLADLYQKRLAKSHRGMDVSFSGPLTSLFMSSTTIPRRGWLAGCLLSVNSE